MIAVEAANQRDRSFSFTRWIVGKLWTIQICIKHSPEGFIIVGCAEDACGRRVVEWAQDGAPFDVALAQLTAELRDAAELMSAPFARQLKAETMADWYC